MGPPTSTSDVRKLNLHKVRDCAGLFLIVWIGETAGKHVPAVLAQIHQQKKDLLVVGAGHAGVGLGVRAGVGAAVGVGGGE